MTPAAETEVIRFVFRTCQFQTSDRKLGARAILQVMLKKLLSILVFDNIYSADKIISSSF